jgi:hypothetical protein
MAVGAPDRAALVFSPFAFVAARAAAEVTLLDGWTGSLLSEHEF